MTDVNRARAFYEGPLGPAVSDDCESHWGEYEPGGSGVFAITDRPEVGRSDAQACGTIAFEAEDALTGKFRAAVGRVIAEPCDTPLGADPSAGLNSRRNRFTFP